MLTLHPHFLSLLALNAFLFLSAPLHAKGTPPQLKKTDANARVETLLELYEKAKNYYVDELSEDKFWEGALKGALNGLDPHSDYLTREEFEGLSERTKGEFGGLGLEVTQEYGVVKVVSPIDDTPAYLAGVKAGDYIIWIDDQPIMGTSLEESTRKMRGTPGTTVKLRIAREGQEPFDVSIKRDTIKVKAVKYRMEGNIGYIRVSTFSELTEKMVFEAVRDIKNKLGQKLQGFILDLRNNPGGLLEQAIAVSDLFLEEGEIVSARGRDPNHIERYNASPGDIASGYPLAVLINAGSASAAEIVAGALQDHKRAIVMGNRSFGKGSVQLVSPMANKQGAMKLTTARYYPPSGHMIQGNGITPDVIINQAKVEHIDDKRRREENLQGMLRPIPAIEKEKEKMLSTEDKKDSAVKNKEEKGNQPLDKREGTEPLKLPESEYDYQLARALDLIKAYAIYREGQGEKGLSVQKTSKLQTIMVK